MQRRDYGIDRRGAPDLLGAITHHTIEQGTVSWTFISKGRPNGRSKGRAKPRISPMAARALGGCALLPVAAVVALAQGAPAPNARAQGARATYGERYRPQYHFTPAVNWMNDPNGLVYADGEWHLFYQYNPFGITWGHMSWGHAVSRDLVHWQHLPVALPEAGGVMAFSGSAVVDSANTSGFGTGGRPPLVALYTGARAQHQAQYVAYSNDRGRTWIRYAGNPVLDIGSAEFRDPKVFWYAPQHKWVMVVSRATAHALALYASPDLTHWTKLSEFGPAGATGGVWECPDLFELPVDGDPHNTRWVMIVNLNPGGVAGGSAAQYFVGRFDGTRFVADSAVPPTPAPSALGVRWADYGKDFYAAVSWADVPRADGRRIWVGWMNNWQYGNQIPTTPWRSAQSVPRTLALTSGPGGVRLVQTPIAELEQLRGARQHLGPQTISGGSTALGPRGIAGSAMEIAAEFAVDTGRGAAAHEFGLKVRTGRGEETVIGIVPGAAAGTGQLFVDRTRSGAVAFHREFGGRQIAPLPVIDGRVRLRIFVDWSSVEVFGADGRVVITDQIFPAPESQGVALYAIGGSARLLALDAWPLASAWTRPGSGSRSAPLTVRTNASAPAPPPGR